LLLLTRDTRAEGRALADEFKCKFLETSAKTNTNVEQAFYEVVRAIRRYNREMAGGPAAGGGLAHNAGAMGKMDIADEDTQAGCCSKCVLM
jgi:GTPase KRas protein